MKIVMLTAATLPVYRNQLAELLMDALTHNGLADYQPIQNREEAASYFHSLRETLSKGERLLWIASDECGVAASVQLEICCRPDGRNRAEIQQLLVHSRARRRGAGRLLLAALEQEAIQRQRGLLYLDTLAGTPAEAFYRSQGYRCLGELPDYACLAEGYYCPAVIYYKRLFTVNQVVRSIAS